jgi:hypothetical protein
MIFETAQLYRRKDTVCPTPSEIQTFGQMIWIVVSMVDRQSLMSAGFSGHRSAIRGEVGSLTANCDLMTTATVPPVRVGALRKRIRMCS